jgi:hypothetical protein
MKKLFFSSVFILFSFLVLPVKAWAANFYLEPASGTYKVGDEFDVAVWVDPSGEDVQTMDIIISYDKTRLETSKEKIKDGQYFESFNSYVFNVYQDTGKLNLYIFSTQGSYSKNTKGKVLTITFKAKSTGTAAVNFVCGSDGDSAIWSPEITNLIVCGANGSGSYTIIASGETSPTSTPTPTPTSAPSGATATPTPMTTGETTPTPTALPQAGFSSLGLGTGLLGGVLLGVGLLTLLF